MADPENIGSAWQTVDGEFINPNAPAGGGGAGRFRAAGSTGTDEPLSPDLPAPDAPVARYLVTPDPLTAGNGVVNPPPVTKPQTIILKQLKDADNDIDVQLEVLADGESSAIKGESAETEADYKGLKIEFPQAFAVKGVVQKFTSPFVMKGHITVHTRYRPGSKSTDRSQYGRGRTAPDEAAGNVTVGFHESCHLADHLDYIPKHALPEFKRRVGMTKTEYQQAVAQFTTDYQQYIKDDHDNSVRLTDEVGKPKKSEWRLSTP